MRLTSKEARTLLEIERKNTTDDRWIEHCISVGDSAERIAKALCEKEINVDIDKAITLGYLHDIGKYNGKSHGNVMRGYEYLKNMGTSHSRICAGGKIQCWLDIDFIPIFKKIKKGD